MVVIIDLFVNQKFNQQQIIRIRDQSRPEPDRDSPTFGLRAPGSGFDSDEQWKKHNFIKNEKNLRERELRLGLFEFLLSWACLAERLSRGNQNHSKTVKSIFNRLSFTLRFPFHNMRLMQSISAFDICES